MAFLGLTAADAALGAAGIQAGGSLLGGVLGAGGQAASNAQQFAQAETMFGQQQTANQHFLDQEENYNTMMSSTAYQRTMADMKAAGLNPILAAGSGPTSIGSSPTASVSPVGTGPVGNPGALMAQGVSSAAQAGQTYLQMKALGQQTDTQASQADLNKTQGDLNAATATNTRASTANIGAQGDQIRANTAAADASARAAIASAGASSASAALDMARTVTEQHHARQASAIADQEQQKAQLSGIAGAPKGSELGRSIQDIGAWLGNAYKSLTNAGTGPASVAPSSARGYVPERDSNPNLRRP